MSKVAIDWVKFRADVRHERGCVSRRVVAAAVGCHQSNIARLEAGEYVPATELFLSLCRWMGREWTRYEVVNSPAAVIES